MEKQFHRKAYTLIELLAFIFVIGVTTCVFSVFKGKYGVLAGLGAATLTVATCSVAVVQFYKWSWRRDKRMLTELRDKYRGIYRVLAVPSDPKLIIAPVGAEIRVGDYGWEAGQIRKDGLIYLQGLTPEWTVVWHGGFKEDQVEKVTEKPASQYDYWHPHWAKPPPPKPCPFPVIERETMTMGLPHHSNRYFCLPSRYPTPVTNVPKESARSSVEP